MYETHVDIHTLSHTLTHATATDDLSSLQQYMSLQLKK
jgi:hypothetical protein